MKAIPFMKIVGAGNDFIVMDYRRPFFKGSLASLAQAVCDRHRSVGADGLLLLERSAQADFKMRYFNSDGSEASMCGNGARCIARFAEIKGLVRQKAVFETRAGIYSAVISPRQVELSMPPVNRSRLGIEIKAGNKKITAHWINTGVPHAVIFVPDAGKIPLPKLGREIRFHKKLGPEGANVDFAQVVSKHRLRMRTYERGVEGETLACGTGAVACACLASMTKGLESPVRVKTQSGQDLQVYFKREGSVFSDIKLVGEARVICEGKIYVN